MSTEPAELDPRWCLGLPFAGTAPLTDAERAAIRLRSMHLVWGIAAAASFVPAVVLAAAWVERHEPRAIAAPFTTLAAALVLLTAPAVVALILAGVVRLRRLRRDARSGTVSVFRGDVHPRLPNRVRDRHERSAIASLPRDGAFEIRVLPHSGSWLRPPGDSSRVEFLHVRIQRAAPPPEYAWRVPVHRDLPVIPAPGVQLEQRQLTERERRELASYARELRRPALHQWFGLVTCGALMWMGTRRGPAAADGILVVGAVILLAFHTRGWFRRMALAGRMHADLSSGRVLSAATVDAEAAPVTREERPREFLPMSRMVWTELGRPAAWRQSPKPVRAAA